MQFKLRELIVLMALIALAAFGVAKFRGRQMQQAASRAAAEARRAAVERESGIYPFKSAWKDPPPD